MEAARALKALTATTITICITIPSMLGAPNVPSNSHCHSPFFLFSFFELHGEYMSRGSEARAQQAEHGEAVKEG